MSHAVRYTLRRMATPPTVTDPLSGRTHVASTQEMRDMGIVHLEKDLYSCVHQERRDPDTLTWAIHDHAHPGEVVSEGSVTERYAKAKLSPGVTLHRWQGESDR